jgi:outer membrane protein TolC
MEKLKYMQPSIKLLLLLLMGTQCSQAQVLSLDSVLVAIEQNNPMLEGYDYKIKAMNTYAKGATSWMPPQVGAGVFMAPYDQRMAREMNGGEPMGQAMFSLEQMIPNPAKQRANKNYMSARSSVEEAAQRETYNGLRAQAKGLYYDWLVLEKKLAVLKENKELIEVMVKLSEVRYPYNGGNLSNIYKAQARLQ